MRLAQYTAEALVDRSDYHTRIQRHQYNKRGLRVREEQIHRVKKLQHFRLFGIIQSVNHDHNSRLMSCESVHTVYQVS